MPVSEVGAVMAGGAAGAPREGAMMGEEAAARVAALMAG